MRALVNVRPSDVLDELEHYAEEEATAVRRGNATLRRRRLAKEKAHGATATEDARKSPLSSLSRLGTVSRAPAPEKTGAEKVAEPEPRVVKTTEPPKEELPSPTLLNPGQLAEYLTALAKERQAANPRAEAKQYIKACRKCACDHAPCRTIRAMTLKQLDDVIRNVRG